MVFSDKNLLYVHPRQFPLSPTHQFRHSLSRCCRATEAQRAGGREQTVATRSCWQGFGCRAVPQLATDPKHVWMIQPTKGNVHRLNSDDSFPPELLFPPTRPDSLSPHRLSSQVPDCQLEFRLYWVLFARLACLAYILIYVYVYIHKRHARGTGRHGPFWALKLVHLCIKAGREKPVSLLEMDM